MYHLLIVLLLATHLICVNLTMGVPWVCIWLEWRQTTKLDDVAGRVGRWLAAVTLYALGAGVLLGVAVLALRWSAGDTRLVSVLARMPMKVWYGAWELVFSMVCLLAYYLWWKLALPKSTWLRCVHRALAVLAATNLIYHFPPLFTVSAQIVASDNTSSTLIDSVTFRGMMYTGEVLAHTAHFWLAALASTGVVIMAHGWNRSYRDAQHRADAYRHLVVKGARMALIATLLQLPVGVWLLLELPSHQQASLLGGNWGAVVLLVTSLTAALALLHHLAAVSIGELRTALIVRAVLLMATVILLMCGTLEFLRQVVKP